MPFFFFQLVRRVTFVLVALYLPGQPFLQMLCYLVASLVMLGYLLSYRVFVDPTTCAMEILNELMVLLVGFHMVMLLSEGSLNSKKRDLIGLSLVLLMITLIALNSMKFVHDQCRKYILTLRRCMAHGIYKRQQTKKRELLRQKSLKQERLRVQK